MINSVYLIVPLLLNTIIVNASLIDRSLSSTVKTPSPEYVRLLDHSMLFYEAQRSGKLPKDNRVSWRHDSALTDGSDINIDLSGGYFDAGNYLKFTFPLCYTVFMLSWGGTDYIDGYQMANQTNRLRSQIKWATDWLIQANPKSSTLVVQVGNTVMDNNYFGPDSGIPLPRPSLQINETHFGTDAAAMAATAFASAATFFNNLATSKAGNEDDAAYAKNLLTHATQLYNASHSILPYTRYQESVPDIKAVYGSTEYIDDLLLSGLAMFKATQNKSYLDQTLDLYKVTTGSDKHTEPLDWDNKWGAFYVLLSELVIDDSGQFLQARINAENYLDGIVSGMTANKTSGGLLFWDSYSNDNSNQNSMSASHLLLSYSVNVLRPLAKDSMDSDLILAKAKRYEDLANTQLDYIFGKNPINQNYIVGERSNSPKYPHSAPASGIFSLKDAIDNPKDLSHAHTIYGALVGGPSRNDSFQDVRLDWSQTEVALDYNAPYQNVLAYQVMYNPNNPFYAPEKTPLDQDQTENGNNPGFPVWGIALAVILPLIFFISLIVCLYLRHRKNSLKKEETRSGDIECENSKEGNNNHKSSVHQSSSESLSTYVNSNHPNIKPFAVQQQAISSTSTL